MAINLEAINNVNGFNLELSISGISNEIRALQRKRYWMIHNGKTLAEAIRKNYVELSISRLQVIKQELILIQTIKNQVNNFR